MCKRLFPISFVVLCLVFMQNSFSQIYLRSPAIQFRDNTLGANQTNHYGDLKLWGGDAGETWGWLYCSKLETYSTSRTSYFYGSLQVYGTKNFVQPHPTDSTKEIVYTCIESGEALTVTRGVALTVNGRITVNLPEDYSLVTSADEPLSVVLTPEGKPALLYVVSKSKQAVIIAVKQEDFDKYGDVQFSYQVTGVRDGFENQQPIQDIYNKSAVSEKRAQHNKKCQAIAEKKLSYEKSQKIK